MILRLDPKTALRGLYDLTAALQLFLYLDRIAHRHFIQVKNIIFVQNVNRQMRRYGVFYRYKLKKRTVHYNEICTLHRLSRELQTAYK